MSTIVPPEYTPGYVYVFRCQQYFKIGKAIDVQDRLRNIQTNNPFLVVVVKIIPTQNMQAVETFPHRKFRSYRERGEWFLLPAECVDWLIVFKGIDLTVTPDMVDPMTMKEADFIRARLRQGVAPGKIAKSLPGYSGRKYAEYMEKVEYVQREVEGLEMEEQAA
jgi:hypothetical protein